MVESRPCNEAELRACLRWARKSNHKDQEQKILAQLQKVRSMAPKAKAKAKASAKPKATKKTAAILKEQVKKVTAKNLKALGKETMVDRISRVIKENLPEDADDPAAMAEAVAKVKASLTTLDISKIHGQYNTAKARSPELAEEASQAKGRLDKGKLALAWFIREKAGGSVWASVTNRMQAQQTMMKTEKWLPELQMKTFFGEDEFNAHLNSGRVSWRECSTPGVYEYMDNQNYESNKKFKKEKGKRPGA